MEGLKTGEEVWEIKKRERSRTGISTQPEEGGRGLWGGGNRKRILDGIREKTSRKGGRMKKGAWGVLVFGVGTIVGGLLDRGKGNKRVFHFALRESVGAEGRS